MFINNVVVGMQQSKLLATSGRKHDCAQLRLCATKIVRNKDCAQTKDCAQPPCKAHMPHTGGLQVMTLKC